MVQMMTAVKAFDETNSGYLDWRELVACLISAAFPIIMNASCADMADQVEVSRAPDTRPRH